jgi:signal transduction histidine kinase
MFAMGTWVTRRIESGVAQVAAATTALSINNLITPHIRELTSSDTLSKTAIKALDQALERPNARLRIALINIWSRNGSIIYSSDPNLIGKSFPENTHVQQAWDGMLQDDFEYLYQLYYKPPEGVRSGEKPYLELFAPVRAMEGSELLAVLEVHEHADALASQLAEQDWNSWIVMLFITFCMIAALFSIVSDGSRVIDEQRATLTRRVSQLSELLQQNRSLRARAENAARSMTENNERFIRRLGCDLHDGVAQMIAGALVRFDRLKLDQADHANGERIQNILIDALSDVRNLCRDMLLPEIQDLTLKAALSLMVDYHQQRTGTHVDLTIGNLPDDAPPFIKITLCRVVQEGLNNAFKHARGQGQKVSATWNGLAITVDVIDEGPGIVNHNKATTHAGLGLIGLRDRIESLGGTMVISSATDAGTHLTSILPLQGGGSGEK